MRKKDYDYILSFNLETEKGEIFAIADGKKLYFETDKYSSLSTGANGNFLKDQLIKNNDTINWIPESIGKGRFGDWLENVQDWGLSRNRYWGTPLNIWECSCGHRHSIGSIAELREMIANAKVIGPMAISRLVNIIPKILRQ